MQLDAERFKASRQTAAAPPTDTPLPPPDPFAGLERHGPWVIIRRDQTGKRATASCAYCLTIREIGISDDTVARCGCSGTSPGAGRFAAPASTFASDKGRGGRRARSALGAHLMPPIDQFEA
ncbi:MAG: hypothetical protein WBQ45_25860, partial [Roseiarcus sp.]